MFLPIELDYFVKGAVALRPNWTKATLWYIAFNPTYITHKIEKKSSKKSMLIDTLASGEQMEPSKVRIIQEPCIPLKMVQNYINNTILTPASSCLLPCAHGFIPKKSVLTNAKPHTGARLWIHMDVKDFFPTITVRRVYGMYRKIFRYEQRLSWLLANLTCYEGKLPQGAPTSPMTSNIIATPMDRNIVGLCNAMGVYYTRYADDLTFSFSRWISRPNTKRFMKTITEIVERHGFKVNEKKTSVISKRRRKMVTGVVVNDVPSAPREFRRNIRAAFHHRKLNLPTADSDEVIAGKLAYVNMLRPGQAESLRKQGKKYGYGGVEK